MKLLISLCAFIPIAVFAKDPGIWSKNNFSSAAGNRNYYLYVPQNKSAAGRWPLFVLLHGCNEDATSFAADTGMNQLAEKYGFVVLYPEQTQADNSLKCWNWFDPKNQKRDSGEMSLIAGMVQKTESSLSIDTNRVYVAGLSAGAAMTSNLIACYPDVFAGAGIHSGLEFEAATSEAEAWTAMSTGSTKDPKVTAADAVRCSGPQTRIPRVMIIHGAGDHTVNPANSVHALEQMSFVDDALDDGVVNGSQSLTAISKSTGQVPNGYSYSIEYFGGGGKVHLANVVVDQMGHAWSGAHQSGPFADPKGPDAGELMWQFFSSTESP